MKRFLTLAMVGVMALGLTSTAYANVCAYDAVPAATLLFPFVQYDYENEDSGDTTLFAITNVSDEAQIVHITVWTDFSVAILDFNITLTGYDVQTINIRDILRDGILPHEGNGANIWELGNAGPAPFADGPFSPFNELWASGLDAWFASQGLPAPEATATSDGAPVPSPIPPLDCDPAVWDSSPNNYQAAGNIPSGTLALFETYLKRSQDADKAYYNCAGTATVDFDVDPWFLTRDSGPAWMYVTADVVGACNKDLPDGSLEYFNYVVGEGVINENVLMGDVIYLNPGQNYSEAMNAVHIEAEPFDPAGPGIDVPELDGATWTKDSSFYLRYHALADSATYGDFREPLPTAWAFRYIVAPDAGAKTWIRAWKGGTLNLRVQDLTEWDDGPPAGPVPITGQNPDELYASSCWPYTYYAWDEDEGVNAVGPGFTPPWSGGPTADPIPVPNLLPLETQEVDAEEFFLVGDPATGAFGWMLFIFPRSNNFDGPVVGVDYDYYQTWMGVKYASFGTYTAGLEGAVMANYNCFFESLPRLGINRFSE
jgi:hypothetical protein